MLKNLLILLCLCGMLVACGKPDVTYTDGKGNRVTASPDGAHMTATDEDGKTVTMDTQDGKTTIKTEDGNTATMEVKDGKTTITDAKAGAKAETGVAISEEELGVSFYPGSREDKESSLKASSPKGNTYMCVRITTDSLEKVLAFYEKELKDVTSYKAEGSIILSGKAPDGATTSVSAMKSPNSAEVKITISLTRS